MFLLHFRCHRDDVASYHCFLVTKALWFPLRVWRPIWETNAAVDKMIESVSTLMTCESGNHTVNIDARTFLWLKLLIVELWVPAQCIFSICVMFSLPLWMASVYCELPLEDLLWDQISLTQWFLLACPLRAHIHIFHSLLVRECFSTVGTPSVVAINLDNDIERGNPNHRTIFKQVRSHSWGQFLITSAAIFW